VNDQLIQPEPEASRKRLGITPISCDEVLDLIPALAFRAIETGSAHLVRLHCESCPACARELADSERVTSLLPFSAPQRMPSSGAKLALMERINAPVPTLFPSTSLASPVVDSPAGKRRAAAPEPGRATELIDWTRDLMSGTSMRLAAAPIALALVIVSLYSLGTFDSSNGENNLVPTAQAAANVNSAVDTAADLEVAFLSAGTGGATLTQPSVDTSGALGSSFMARSSRSLAQTELMRSVAPTFAECSIEKGASGSWRVEVTGVSLANLNEPADVYLVSKTGQLVEIGDVFLDHNGNGVINFVLNQPLSDFSFIQIGPNDAQPAAIDTPEHYTFRIDLDGRLSQGLGRPD
jgi:hypothetical protein